MSSHGNRNDSRRKPPVEDVISDGSDGDEMEDDVIAGALYTRDGMPLSETLVYIATAMSNLSNNLHSIAEKSLRLQKFIAKQVQVIAECLAADREGPDVDEDDEANSTAAQMNAAPDAPQQQDAKDKTSTSASPTSPSS